MESIKDILPKALAPGIIGHYAHGQSLTLGYVILDKDSRIQEHKHVHEQITFIVEGQLDMVIDGKPYSLTKGTYHVIPSNIPHSATAKTNCIAIDAFSPVREDYRS